MVLDDEVAALIMRIGSSLNPKNHIGAYTVERDVNAPTTVTVKLYVDEQFSSYENTSTVDVPTKGE
jgi:hypothetical protein